MIRIVPIFIMLLAAFMIAIGIESPGDQIVTTRHQIKVGQRTLRYTARAGRLPIRHNETGEIHSHVVFVAYLLDRLPNEPARPLIFLRNGGPGSNSTLVHLTGFGPKPRRTAAIEAGRQQVYTGKTCQPLEIIHVSTPFPEKSTTALENPTLYELLSNKRSPPATTSCRLFRVP